MRSLWTVLAIAALGVTLAAADEELYKGAKVKTLSSTPQKNEVKKGVVTEAKKPQPQAQDRQDTYGAPQSPVQDSYGSPQAAPVQQDSYGAPQAAPVASAPVQGEVGTQGYYYYYYPVANSHSPTQNYQSNKVSSSSSSSSGLLGGSNNIGVIIFLGLGALVVLALVAATFTNNNNRRSFAEGLLGQMDTDELMFQVYNAIELYNRWT